jgi:hypothetical protein
MHLFLGGSDSYASVPLTPACFPLYLETGFIIGDPIRLRVSQQETHQELLCAMLLLAMPEQES